MTSEVELVDLPEAMVQAGHFNFVEFLQSVSKKLRPRLCFGLKNKARHCSKQTNRLELVHCTHYCHSYVKVTAALAQLAEGNGQAADPNTPGREVEASFSSVSRALCQV